MKIFTFQITISTPSPEVVKTRMEEVFRLTPVVNVSMDAPCSIVDRDILSEIEMKVKASEKSVSVPSGGHAHYLVGRLASGDPHALEEVLMALHHAPTPLPDTVQTDTMTELFEAYQKYKGDFACK